MRIFGVIQGLIADLESRALTARKRSAIQPRVLLCEQKMFGLVVAIADVGALKSLATIPAHTVL